MANDTRRNDVLTSIYTLLYPKAAKCFHLGESVFRSDTFPQLYRTWDSFEITDTLSSDPELCLIAEEVRRAYEIFFKQQHADNSSSTFDLMHPTFFLL